MKGAPLNILSIALGHAAPAHFRKIAERIIGRAKDDDESFKLVHTLVNYVILAFYIGPIGNTSGQAYVTNILLQIEGGTNVI